MRRSDSLPAPPELPSFTVEAEADDVVTDVTARHHGTGLVRHAAPLPDDRIDSDAAKVVRRLERAGHQAYLVGGCVRDLLLGGKPKDFDVATSARPDDVKALFRNCRVIGRRFRLAHVLFGPSKVIEVATFRKNPTDLGIGLAAAEEDGDDDLLIRSDNVFGDAHEDALRRDFTVNALFYDLDRRQVLDWCGGMEDVRARTLRTIGEANVRFREDPVRILRAIKFAARADLAIDPVMYDAMVLHRDELARAARPRLFEEIMRLLRGGAAHRSMWLFWEMGAMAVLLPEVSSYLDDDEGTSGGAARFFRAMDAIDAMTKQGRVLDDLVLTTALLFEPMWEAITGVKDPSRALQDFLGDLSLRIAITRRVADGIRRVVAMLPKLAQGKVGRFQRTEHYGAALDVLEIVMRARGDKTGLVERLRSEAPPDAAPTPERSGREGGGREGGRGRDRGFRGRGRR